MEMLGQVEIYLGEVQRLALIKVNYMTYACTVHMYQCIYEL